MQKLAQFRGSPVVLLFRPESWDPAEREIVDLYNRLIGGLSLPASAGAKLIRVRRDGEWHSLAFDDDALSLPVIDADSTLGERAGLTSDRGVVVLDANGEVRWRFDGDCDPNTADLARAVTDAALPSSRANGWSRREFVATVFGVAAALSFAPSFARAERVGVAGSQAGGPPGDPRSVTLNINGRDVTLQLEPRVTLLDALREYSGMTGTKKGCDHGQCGACTVHLDGRRALSCMTFAVMQQGTPITTIEGLARGDELHPMQQAFITHDGFQCGYCTPGQIMSAAAMVNEPWGPDDDSVREAMSGNICRCGAYVGIVAAIQDVRSTKRAAQ